MLHLVVVGALALAAGRAPRGAPARGAAARRGHARAVLERTQLGDKDRLLDTSMTDRALRGPTVRAKDGRKLKVGIVGAGLGGMVTAMDLSEAGYDVEMFEARRFVGGKVSSWLDKDGNHIEMGLHVFFGCYYNLFGIMKRVGAYEPGLRLKEHRHTFVNKGGTIGELDFRMGGIGAPLNGLKAFATSAQLGIGDKIANALALGNPISCPIVQVRARPREGARGLQARGGRSAGARGTRAHTRGAPPLLPSPERRPSSTLTAGWTACATSTTSPSLSGSRARAARAARSSGCGIRSREARLAGAHSRSPPFLAPAVRA